jgi:hypothetical protein
MGNHVVKRGNIETQQLEWCGVGLKAVNPMKMLGEIDGVVANVGTDIKSRAPIELLQNAAEEVKDQVQFGCFVEAELVDMVANMIVCKDGHLLGLLLCQPLRQPVIATHCEKIEQLHRAAGFVRSEKNLVGHGFSQTFLRDWTCGPAGNTGKHAIRQPFQRDFRAPLTGVACRCRSVCISAPATAL